MNSARQRLIGVKKIHNMNALLLGQIKCVHIMNF